MNVRPAAALLALACPGDHSPRPCPGPAAPRVLVSDTFSRPDAGTGGSVTGRDARDRAGGREIRFFRRQRNGLGQGLS